MYRKWNYLLFLSRSWINHQIKKKTPNENIDEENYKFQYKEDINNIEQNSQKFENESRLCSIIREDLIVNFIKYVNQINISLLCQRLILEKNSILIE